MKTKNHTRYLLIMSILFTSLSCNEAAAVIGRGNISTEARTVEKFDAIELRSHANVEIKKGTEYKVEVSDYENLLPYIVVRNTGNSLIIDSKDYTAIVNSKCRIIVTMPAPLYAIELKGSGNFYLQSEFNDLSRLSILGSGNIYGEVPLKLNDLETQIAGSGNIELKGTAETVKATIAGSGDIYLSNLAAGNVECMILGSGDIEIKAIETLNASVNGSGDIRYSGNPLTELQVNGSGKIEKI
ncbi:MAG: head GIN domain-containing protein [Paludibacter sp.]|nr:head GIN domain-containing protein [Paludibacter sp.]